MYALYRLSDSFYLSDTETCEFDGKEPLFVERVIAVGRKTYSKLNQSFGMNVYIDTQIYGYLSYVDL